MRIIVTGSSGFIGSYLVSYLNKSHQHHVLEYDRKIDKEAIDCVDIIRYADVVIHLAAQTSVFNEDIEQIRKDNIDTFIQIATECNRTGTKLVYASSSTAYNITSMYGLSKKFDEEFARIYCPSATGLRFHNVYSENPREGTLLWCLLNKHTELYNMGQNIRCYTWVMDVVEGICKAIFSDKQLLNIVNVEPLTTKEFADKVSKYYDISYECVSKIRDKDNPVQLIFNEIPIMDIAYSKVDTVLSKIHA